MKKSDQINQINQKDQKDQKTQILKALKNGKAYCFGLNPCDYRLAATVAELIEQAHLEPTPVGFSVAISYLRDSFSVDKLDVPKHVYRQYAHHPEELWVLTHILDGIDSELADGLRERFKTIFGWTIPKRVSFEHQGRNSTISMAQNFFCEALQRCIINPRSKNGYIVDNFDPEQIYIFRDVLTEQISHELSDKGAVDIINEEYGKFVLDPKLQIAMDAIGLGENAIEIFRASSFRTMGMYLGMMEISYDQGPEDIFVNLKPIP